MRVDKGAGYSSEIPGSFHFYCLFSIKYSEQLWELIGLQQLSLLESHFSVWGRIFVQHCVFVLTSMSGHRFLSQKGICHAMHTWDLGAWGRIEMFLPSSASCLSTTKESNPWFAVSTSLIFDTLESVKSRLHHPFFFLYTVKRNISSTCQSSWSFVIMKETIKSDYQQHLER